MSTEPPPPGTGENALGDFDDGLHSLVVDSEVVANASLHVVSGHDTGRTFMLIGRESLIGRVAGAQIRLDDKSVSAHHAKILWDGEHHRLKDLGSTNGTFLNAERLAPDTSVELTVGDSIQVADVLLAYGPARRGPDGHTQQLTYLTQPKTDALRGSSTQELMQLLTLMRPQPEPPAPSFDEQLDKLIRLGALARRHLVVFLSCGALGALVGDLTVFAAPPLSEASFNIRITAPSGDSQQGNSERAVQDFYAAVEQDFVNPASVERTMIAMGESDLSPKHLQAFMTNLKFDALSRQTYLGAFTHRDPNYAVGFLSRHLEAYLASEVEKSIHVVQAQVDFLGARLKEREDELEKTEAELQDFKSKHMEGLPDFAAQHVTTRESLYERRAELSGRLSRSNLELGLARKRLEDSAPTSARKVENASPYQAALVETRRRLAEAQARGLGQDHPEIIKLKKEIEEEQRLADQARSTDMTDLERKANQGLGDLRARVGDLEVETKGTSAELGEVNGQMQRLDSIMTQMPEVEAKYAQLTRSYAASKDLHTKLFEELKASQIRLDLERTSAKARYEVLSPPTSAGIALRRVLAGRAVVGAGIGVVLGVLLVAFRELRKHVKARLQVSKAIVRRSSRAD